MIVGLGALIIAAVSSDAWLGSVALWLIVIAIYVKACKGPKP